MEDVSTAEARKNLADLLNRVAYTKERFVVKRRGREVAAIVPVEDVDLLDRLRGLLAQTRVREALEELEGGEAIPWSELKEELGL